MLSTVHLQQRHQDLLHGSAKMCHKTHYTITTTYERISQNLTDCADLVPDIQTTSLQTCILPTATAFTGSKITSSCKHLSSSSTQFPQGLGSPLKYTDITTAIVSFFNIVASHLCYHWVLQPGLWRALLRQVGAWVLSLHDLKVKLHGTAILLVAAA